MRVQSLRTAIIAGFSCLVVVGCGGAPKSALLPLPPPATEGTLAGATCQAAKCACRDDKRKIGIPESGQVKRFEVKVGPIRNPLWVKIGKTQLYKTDQTATQCFYVDLPPGKHDVVVQGKGDHGVAARVSISEMAPKEVGWYETFYFHCGGVDTCSVTYLNEFAERLKKYKKNVHDPCGSTKIRNIAWRTGKLPDNLHPNHIQLSLTLDVYPFVPKRPPGHAKCRDKF